MKSILIAVLTLLALPVIGQPMLQHGVERGRVLFPPTSGVPTNVKDVVSSTVQSRCASLGREFLITAESVRVETIDQGMTDYIYTLLIQVNDSAGQHVDTVKIEVADLAIYNPAIPSVQIDELVSLVGLCK